ncbi:FAS1-like dehydratase domain-containing protein [Niveispirillum fermenti]|uniref:FAS1-like dehydratase domain-containing protein n=1 Tax=Niveispirillum fermenti TaxID=1233113 RepID=UPI003A83F066
MTNSDAPGHPANGITDYADWIGRTERQTDIATEAPLRGLEALLDHEGAPADTLPPLGHWLYFLPSVAQAGIGEDGHPRKGGFLPPVPLPRRMWAGGRLRFQAPIPLGAMLERVSTILSVTTKQGKEGPLVFVTVQHEVSADGRSAVSEEHDIVYRVAADPSAGPAPVRRLPAAQTPDAKRRLTADPVRLFRFSALTFNGHRIHYDRDYARDVEAYPGLVVHGPYQAVLLIDHFRRSVPGATVARFDFRGRAPLFDTDPFELCLTRPAAGPCLLWTADMQGGVAMQAELEVA